MAMLLTTKDIVVGYQKFTVINGVSIEVEAGTVVAIIGPNGAGKTTILRAISGLNHPTSGEIWFAGHKIDRLQTQKIVKTFSIEHANICLYN